jgi:nucleoside-diphosphate-sugar epimerase
MRVLVTGGSGFLGSHVAEQLKDGGHDVVCLVRRSSNTSFLRELGVEMKEGAIDAPETLPAALDGVEAVVHCAGVVKARSEADFERVHKGGTLALAEAAKKHAKALKRFVHVSTAGVMGPGRSGKKHVEDDTPNPATPYSRSKLAGEQAILERAGELPVVVIRPPAIYGPRDQEILAFFQMVRRTRFAFRMGGSMKTMSLVYGPDCADAIVRAITADVPSGRIYFVEDGATYTYEEMARAIAAAYEQKLFGTPNIPVPIVTAAALGSELFGKVTGKVMIFKRDKLPELLIEHFAVDGTRARDELGWKPTTHFEEGARLTAAWYRKHRWD